MLLGMKERLKREIEVKDRARNLDGNPAYEPAGNHRGAASP